MKYMLFKHTEGEKIIEMSRAASSKQMLHKDPQKVAVLSKYFQNSIAKKSKRFRSAFTTEQINYLEGEFRKFPYIGSANRKEVANKLKIPERAVKIWFQNRRMKEKKEVSNKALDMDEIIKDATLSNEPLNNVVNWQSHNGRCCPVERPNTCQINFPNNLTTSNCIKLNEKLRPSNKSVNSKEIPPKCLNKPISVTTKRINNMDTSAAFQKSKIEPKIAPLERPKQDNVKAVTAKKQNKGYTDCQSNRHLNLDQDMPQDLSSRNIPKNAYIHHYHHPINTIAGTGFIPLQTQTYPQTSLPRGNVIWKPVNVVSSLAGLSTSVPMAVHHNNGTRIPVVNHIKSNCGCNCNCHVTPLRGFNHVDMTRIHPQYVIAIPYNNPSK